MQIVIDRPRCWTWERASPGDHAGLSATTGAANSRCYTDRRWLGAPVEHHSTLVGRLTIWEAKTKIYLMASVFPLGIWQQAVASD